MSDAGDAAKTRQPAGADPHSGLAIVLPRALPNVDAWQRLRLRWMQPLPAGARPADAAPLAPKP